jgi:uncharacterized protein (DUF885 family)
MTPNRRTMIKGASAAAVLASLPDATFAKGQTFSGVLATFADEIMSLAPETATSLGLDTGKRLALKSRLTDISPTGEAKWAAQVGSMKKRLQLFRRDTLSATDKVRYDTVMFAAERGIEAKAFKMDNAAAGFFGLASPYPVSQQDGAVSAIPEFLNAQHQIGSKSDAEAYLARAASLAKTIDAETGIIRRDAAIGIMPPNFVAKKALGQLQGYRAQKASTQGLVSSLVSRAAKAGLAGDWEGRITNIVEKLIYPAIDRQVAAFTTATAKATDIAGVHRHPDGEAYYAWTTKLGTTSNLSPQEIHQIGLEQNRDIMAQMDVLLKSQGMTKGTVGERVQALNSDPRLLAPNTDAGRADLIAYCNDIVAKQRALMPRISRLGLKAPLLIKRVPVDIEEGASLGYMNFGSLDGSRPAIYYLNLKSTSLWPKYQLATLTAHEGVPGHAWQGAYLAENNKDIPTILSLTAFNAFVEGWALYSEQLVDEFGLYEKDPLSKIGYLQAQQFRACRLVVDTGLHALRWTRDQSINFLVENTGKGRDAMTSETDRYCVAPGQALGYKVGHNEILRLRQKAKAALGAKFDLATFNDEIVKTGGVPLTVLTTAIDDYVARAR